ncbi:MAG TPA: hypothetical protein VGQ06_10145 [Gemmatimonadales bacterium]|nr:hypothetical protein [Gemmatimonadales bacterium]
MPGITRERPEKGEKRRRGGRAACRLAQVTAAVALVTAPLTAQRPSAEPPPYLRDRGTGVRTSLLGTYVRQREVLVYAFFEWYADKNLEYKPSELGYGPSVIDYRGRYRASEGLVFFGYGLTPDVALEFEAAVISAELRTSPDDTSSAKPPRVRESGDGDVEGQIRWRFQRETASRPELFTYFGTVLPLQKDRHIIGTQHWEHFFGLGLVKGFRWGTMTVRVAAEYSAAASPKFDAGEYAIEYLRRLSPKWCVVAAIEGSQVDEVSLITETQWQPSRHVTFKFNHALGVTMNSTDFAPEVGLMISF